MMPNPYLIIGALVAAIGLALGGYLYGHHVEALAFDAYKAQQAADAAQQVTSNHDAVAASAASEAAGLRTINTDLKEQYDALAETHVSTVIERDQLAQRLQQYVARASQHAAAVPQAGSGASVTNAASNSAFSIGFSDLTGWIGNELYAADQLAAQLTAAQQLIAQDRQICNGMLPGVTP